MGKLAKKPKNITFYLANYVSIKNGAKSPQLKYCFGSFENLIYMPESMQTIPYFTLLLSTYDQCKGYIRSFKGDPVGITLLRNAIKCNNIDDLYNHNFAIYAYDYTKIHAHTVTYFSLSTLILFFVSNYMHYKSYNSYMFDHIDLNKCKEAYKKKVYGDFSYAVSSPIPIKIIPKNEIKSINSWPGTLSEVVPPNRCTHCSRICEHFWGKHKHCLDCHLYKVCSICGGEKIMVATDNYPRCILHQHD